MYITKQDSDLCQIQMPCVPSVGSIFYQTIQLTQLTTKSHFDKLGPNACKNLFKKINGKFLEKIAVKVNEMECELSNTYQAVCFQIWQVPGSVVGTQASYH